MRESGYPIHRFPLLRLFPFGKREGQRASFTFFLENQAYAPVYVCVSLHAKCPLRWWWGWYRGAFPLAFVLYITYILYVWTFGSYYFSSFTFMVIRSFTCFVDGPIFISRRKRLYRMIWDNKKIIKSLRLLAFSNGIYCCIMLTIDFINK